jgi:cytochrome c peroxidase
MNRLTVVFFGALGAMACGKEAPEPEHHAWKPMQSAAAPEGVEVDSAKLAMYAPLPKPGALDDKAALGRLLFFDKRLSKAQDLSCSSCHDLANYGMDGKDFSVGAHGKKLGRNTPSIYDASLEFAQFWDGRADTVELASSQVLLNPNGMAQPDEKHVADLLGSIPAYVDAFKKAFPADDKPITLKNTGTALGAFARVLLTPSPWDQFLAGDKKAMTDDQKNGFSKFVEVGCPTCHVGALVGGTMSQILGKVKPWPNQADKGRSLVTKSPSDNMMFRVPGLRNVEHTAPYFHDASETTLEGAVKKMATYQLGKELTEDDTKSIVTWLKTLSGTPPTDITKAPDLPPSSPKTPKPDKT